MILDIILIILWLTIGLNYLVTIAPAAQNLKPQEGIILGIIVFIGTPFMFVGQVTQSIIDSILPEGWDDDDKFGY